LSSKATVTPPVATAESMRPMEIDFEAAADKWDTAAEFLKKEFAWAD